MSGAQSAACGELQGQAFTAPQEAKLAVPLCSRPSRQFKLWLLPATACSLDVRVASCSLGRCWLFEAAKSRDDVRSGIPSAGFLFQLGGNKREAKGNVT